MRQQAQYAAAIPAYAAGIAEFLSKVKNNRTVVVAHIIFESVCYDLVSSGQNAMLKIAPALPVLLLLLIQEQSSAACQHAHQDRLGAKFVKRLHLIAHLLTSRSRPHKASNRLTPVQRQGRMETPLLHQDGSGEAVAKGQKKERERIY